MTTSPPDNTATTWRDLADQLTSTQIAELDYCERHHIPPGLADTEHRLDVARMMARRNIVQSLCADIAPPPDASDFIGDWEASGDRYVRLYDAGPVRLVSDAAVFLCGTRSPAMARLNGTSPWPSTMDR